MMTLYDYEMAQLKKLKSFHNGSYGASINFAIDTMCKYQKIREIVEAWKADVDIDSYDCIADIYEVLEDGNDII